MKPLLPILLWLCLATGKMAIAQAKEVSSFGNQASKYDQKVDTTAKVPLRQAQGGKPEIFTSGFIDIVNNGQVNASARFIRLFIGEPGKFAIPISFYGGVSVSFPKS